MSRLKKDVVDIFRYIFFGWNFISFYGLRDMIMEQLLPPEALKKFKKQMSKKDTEMEKTTNFNKFIESLSFMIFFLWKHKYFTFMYFYVFKLKLPYTVFTVAYKFHDFLFKYVLYLRLLFYWNKIKFKFSKIFKVFSFNKKSKTIRFLRIKVKIFIYLFKRM